MSSKPEIITFCTGHASLRIDGREVAFCRSENGGADMAQRIADALTAPAATPVEDERVSLFQDTIARLADDGTWHLMNRAAGGWREFGRRFSTLTDITQRFRVRLGAGGSDECSAYVHVLRDDQVRQ